MVATMFAGQYQVRDRWLIVLETHHAATLLASPIPPMIIESRRSRMVAMSAAVPGSADCVGWLAPVVVGLEDVADEKVTELGIDDAVKDAVVDVADSVAFEVAEDRMDDTAFDDVATFPELVRFELEAAGLAIEIG